MTQIEIFRAGTHQPMQGAPVTLSEADLRAMAAAYDAGLHEAPVVAGHPKHDAPAYGWVKGLSVRDGVLVADAADMDPQFAELIRQGRFRKVSASFYPPDSPSNPKPGAWALRHVGFLGAQPPAVKGLRNAQFADAGEAVEFAGAADMAPALARFLRRLREWLLTSQSAEVADSLTPEWEIEDLNRQALAAAPDFSETAQGRLPTKQEEESVLSAEAIAAREAALVQQEEALAAREREVEAQAAAFAEREASRRHEENEAIAAEAVRAGRLAPALRPGIVQFMDGLESGEAVNFAEGAEKQTPLEFFRDLLARAAPLVDFGERAAGDDAPAFADGEALGRAARAHIAAQAKLGVHVSPDQAVREIRKRGQA